VVESWLCRLAVGNGWLLMCSSANEPLSHPRVFYLVGLLEQFSWLCYSENCLWSQYLSWHSSCVPHGTVSVVPVPSVVVLVSHIESLCQVLIEQSMCLSMLWVSLAVSVFYQFVLQNLVSHQYLLQWTSSISRNFSEQHPGSHSSAS